MDTIPLAPFWRDRHTEDTSSLVWWQINSIDIPQQEDLGSIRLLAPAQRLISPVNESWLHLDLLSLCKEYVKGEPKIKVHSRRLASRAPHRCVCEALPCQALIQPYPERYPVTHTCHPCNTHTRVTRGGKFRWSLISCWSKTRLAFLLVHFLTVFAYCYFWRKKWMNIPNLPPLF